MTLRAITVAMPLALHLGRGPAFIRTISFAAHNTFIQAEVIGLRVFCI